MNHSKNPILLLALALAAGAHAQTSLETAETQLEAAYVSLGQIYQGGFRHRGRGGETWEYRGRQDGNAVGELHISQALGVREGFQGQLDAAGAALDEAAREVAGPLAYARLTRAITDYDTLVDFGKAITLREYTTGQSTPTYPLLVGHEVRAWTAPARGDFDLAEFRQLAEAQLLAVEEASATVPLLSCDSDENTGYHERSNHFTRILHTTTPQEFYGERVDPKRVGFADPYEAMAVKETAWEILGPALRFKGARNATRAYLRATGSSRPAPEFDLPIQGADLLGYKMADWETLVAWAQVVRVRFGTRSPQRDFFLLKALATQDPGPRDPDAEYRNRHLYREPAGGTTKVGVDREAGRELPDVPLFGDEGGEPAPAPAALDAPGYDDLVGVPG